jgi:hypothetical protein
MHKSKTSFNPSRFRDMLSETQYASGLKGEKRKSEREDLVAWLRKKGKRNQACLTLADKLADCRPKHRCKSAACPECAPAGQRLVSRVVRRFLKAPANGGKVVWATIIPADGMTKSGKLSKSDHERAVRRWKEKLGKAGVSWFVGATDWSFNEHKQGKHKSRWSEHIHGVTVTKNPMRLRKKLRKLFPNAKTVRRPVTVIEWDGDAKALRYILKPNFLRRIANDQGQRHDKKSGMIRSCHDTDAQPLRAKCKEELLVHLDDIGIQSRLVMRQCQLLKLKGQGATLVMRPPKRR